MLVMSGSTTEPDLQPGYSVGRNGVHSPLRQMGRGCRSETAPKTWKTTIRWRSHSDLHFTSPLPEPQLYSNQSKKCLCMPVSFVRFKTGTWPTATARLFRRAEWRSFATPPKRGCRSETAQNNYLIIICWRSHYTASRVLRPTYISTQRLKTFFFHQKTGCVAGLLV